MQTSGAAVRMQNRGIYIKKEGGGYIKKTWGGILSKGQQRLAASTYSLPRQ